MNIKVMEFPEKTIDGSLDGSVAPLLQSIHYDESNFTTGGPLTTNIYEATRGKTIIFSMNTDDGGMIQIFAPT